MTTTPTDEQQAVIDLAASGGNIVVQAGAGTGKALRDDQRVHTPSGWKPIGALQAGDLVTGSDGRPTEVLGVYPQGVRPLFEVTTSDGVRIIADADHRWTTQTTGDRQEGRWGVRTTVEIADTLTVRHGDRVRPDHRLPMLSAPVAGRDADLPLDPWLIGVLVGVGGFPGGGVRLSDLRWAILDRVRAVLPGGVELAPVPRCGPDGLDWVLTACGRPRRADRRGVPDPVAAAVAELGLAGTGPADRFVPEQVVAAGARQRAAFVRGVFDADGHPGEHSIEFSTPSRRLAVGVQELVRSLGGTASLGSGAPQHLHRGERRRGHASWRLHACLPAGVAPVRPARDAEQDAPRTGHRPRRRIVSVVPVEPDTATCIEVAAADELFAVEGYVLTHNTSLLQMTARDALAGKRVLYLAYNKAIVEDSRAGFGDNVEARTAHSLAFAAEGRRFSRRLGGARLPSVEVGRRLGADWLRLPGARDVQLSPARQAMIATDTVRRFCHSSDDRLTASHVPFQHGITGMADAELRRVMLPLAERVWADTLDPDGVLPFSHDGYLKIWALSRPRIDADVILLDEGQDTNPVLEAVLRAQDHTQQIVAGDSAQQLYAWRAAVDTLSDWPDAVTRYLTRSWRFGPAIAEEANRWLSLVGTPLRLVGNPAMESEVGQVAAPEAVLARTNAGAMTAVIDGLERDEAVALVGGGTPLRRLARAAEELQQRGKTSHPELYAFESWDQLVEYAEEEESGRDLLPFVRLVGRIGAAAVAEAADALVSEQQADLTVSTVHRSKGRQWSSVRVAADFPVPPPDAVVVAEAEAMVGYVAVSRARHRLDRAGLAWVDKWTTDDA